MSDHNTVAEVWKFAAYTEGAVIVTLAGTIVAMARWGVKERTKMAEQYATLNKRLYKALDRIGDHLRDLTNELRKDKKQATRTQYDFNINSDDDD